jgi:CheY-like chemotaxis protein
VNEKAGLTFAKSLRSVLRQDPNVVFVGEIRDGETAEIALRAAMTGHLVLSTVHTNDAAATVTRLLDLDIEPYLVASSLSGVLAQRLIRTICDNCREAYEPDPAVVKKVEEAMGMEFSFLFYHGKGCEKCDGTGYRGRLGLHEFLPITPEVREIIRTQGSSEAKIRQAARKEGFRTLLEDALEKMKMGMTSVEEVERVVIFTPEKSTESRCPSCGKTVDATWNSCPFCGTKSGDAAANPAVPALPTAAPTPVASVPLATPPAPPVALKPPAPLELNKDFTGAKVLIVDDEDDVARPLAMMLLKQKFCVSVAANGKEALEAIERDRPHILLTDILMPEMDGLELVRTLRRDSGTAFMPIILFSQKTAVEDRLQGFEAGSDDYLPKPFDPVEMLGRVKAVLRRAFPAGFNAQNH